MSSRNKTVTPATGPAAGLQEPSAPERTRANIIDVARQEFSEKGLAGARVDEIAERTNTSKRMIYYYFESKEGLYRAVLEQAYEQIRLIESNLNIEQLAPQDALRELVGATFDWHNQHPDFVRLVMNENIHHAEHIAGIGSISTRRQTIINLLQQLLQRGVKAGVFRRGLDPIDLHMSISALCFYNVSNRHTFSRIFERDMNSPKAVAARRAIITDTILRWCSIQQPV